MMTNAVTAACRPLWCLLPVSDEPKRQYQQTGEEKTAASSSDERLTGLHGGASLFRELASEATR